VSYEFYKIVHLFGMFLSFSALAGAAGAAATAKADGLRKRFAAVHGTGLLLAFVAGFGMHAKLHLAGFPGWFLAKLVLWILVGALIIVPRRKPDLANALFVAVPVLGLVGAWLAIAKPF
jgi:hypothetical protein